jgi:hypothetical protein
MFLPVRVSDVLRMDCAAVTDGTGRPPPLARLACKIRANDHAVTQGYYAGLVGLVFALFVVVVPFRRRFWASIATRVIYLPLAILFGIYLLVLPLSYGTLVMPNDFAEVNLQVKKDAEVRIPEGPFFLIHQGDKYLILWHTGNEASYVIPTSTVTTLEVIDRASLFSEPSTFPKTSRSGGTP